MLYTEYSSYYEAEKVDFTAKEVVLAENGQEVENEAALHMTREFFSEEEMAIAMGDALKDPLVVGFSGIAAELTLITFAFNIDLDGNEERIPFVGAGSRALALDNNGDGTVNGGSELFGARTENGFAELIGYDEDGNRRIDENEDVYSRFRIWTKEGEGNNQLFVLGAKGGSFTWGILLFRFLLPMEKINFRDRFDQRVSSLMKAVGGTVQQLDLVV